VSRKSQQKKRKLPAFKYSTRNKSEAAYKDRLRVLKQKFGVKTSLSLNKKLTPQAKSSITKLTRKYSGYLNPENRFEFVPGDKRTLRAIKKRGDYSAEAITQKGVFIQKPKSRKKGRFTLKQTGEIELRLGSRVNQYSLFRSEDIVKDPELVRREAKKRGANYVLINIKGYQGKTTYSVESFMQYLSDSLIPDIEEAWEDQEKDSAFRRYFGVEFVTFNRQLSKRRKSNKKRS
jgi:hypothetical protein